MKYIFSFLLTFSFYFSFGQMTVSEMIRVFNMDMDQFETFAINKGYEFNELKNDENVYGHTYLKGSGKNTKYLKLYSRYFDNGVNVNYQTSNPNEYLNIKNQIKSLGFKIFSTDNWVDKNNVSVQIKKYRNNIYEIGLISGIGTGDYEIYLQKY